MIVSCTAASGDVASLDGSVTISLDGTTAVHDGLADGTAEFSASGADASFLVVASVQCDTAEPAVTYEAVGVGSAPVPGAGSEVDAVPMADVVPVAYSGYSLPATGIDMASGSGLASLALVAVVAGAALVRVARRATA